MALVDPPPQQIPTKFQNDPELSAYFTYVNKFLFDLWRRTGGGFDAVEGNANLTADQEFSGNNTFSGSINLDAIVLTVNGIQVVGAQGAVVADAAAATAANPSAPTAFTAPSAGGATVTSISATDLTTTAQALETLRDEVAGYELVISALIVDVANIRAQFNTLLARTRAHGLIDT